MLKKRSAIVLTTLMLHTIKLPGDVKAFQFN